MRKNGRIRVSGKRSALEDRFSTVLAELGIDEQYEVKKVKYVVPESNHTYLVDFVLPNGICIEVKGYLRDAEERKKYILIKEQHPEVDLRFVFDNPDKPITRTKMTHATWCDKEGFKWCGVRDYDIIKQWTSE